MNLQERDKKHIWHPLTQHQNQPNSLPIVRAKGVLLFDEEGNEYIDGIASWYTSMYGHCNPHITSKVAEQMQNLDQIVFSGFTHEPAVKLSEDLMKILPDNQQKIFFSDNGSTANEIAIKMALQYYFNINEKRNTIIAFENGFHGDTFGAMSVSGLDVYNGPFSEFFIDVKRIPVPTAENIDSVLINLQKHISDNQVAAFIYEPLVQGANCMSMFLPEHLDQVLGVCKANKILCIADEVMTGFGKTGKNFASEHMEHQPDIISLGKSLTAGFVPMAITTCTQKIYDAFLDDSVGKAFFHAHTYTANPIACAVAIAGLELLQSDEIQNNIALITKMHQQFGAEIKTNNKIATTRQNGVIFALELNIEMDRYGSKRQEIFDFFMKNGVCLRPLGKTIYILPPFVITSKELQKIYDVIKKLLAII